MLQVVWLHNGTVIDAVTRTNIMRAETTDNQYTKTHILKVNFLQPVDLGVYECVGQNEHGEADAKIKLTGKFF